jgi:hypothetical protein
MDREATILATVREWRSTPFVWGQADCLLSPANYIRAFTGLDGGAEWRGTYHDEPGGLAVLAANGGGLAAFARGMAAAGARKVDRPERGDVVIARIGGHEIGGLCLGDTVLLRRLRGAVEVDVRFVEILGAWRP